MGKSSQKTYLRIIEMLADGKSSKQIAPELGLTIATVDTYKINMYREYNVFNAAHLVSYCYKNKILQ